MGLAAIHAADLGRSGKKKKRGERLRERWMASYLVNREAGKERRSHVRFCIENESACVRGILRRIPASLSVHSMNKPLPQKLHI